MAPRLSRSASRQDGEGAVARLAKVRLSTEGKIALFPSERRRPITFSLIGNMAVSDTFLSKSFTTFRGG